MGFIRRRTSFYEAFVCPNTLRSFGAARFYSSRLSFNPNMPVDCSRLKTLDTSILETLSGDRTFLIEVCDSFLADAPKRMEVVRAAIAANNPAAIDNAAHAMKSLSSCVGAMHLFEICRQIEAAGKNQTTVPARELITRLNAEYASVITVIEAYKSAL